MYICRYQGVRQTNGDVAMMSGVAAMDTVVFTWTIRFADSTFETTESVLRCNNAWRRGIPWPEHNAFVTAIDLDLCAGKAAASHQFGREGVEVKCRSSECNMF